MEKLNELSTGEKLISGAGILLLLDSFILPWYDVDTWYRQRGIGDPKRLGVSRRDLVHSCRVNRPGPDLRSFGAKVWQRATACTAQ